MINGAGLALSRRKGVPEQGDQEVQGLIFGVLGAVVFGILLLVGGITWWKGAAGPAAIVLASNPESNLAPIGEPLARLSFAGEQPDSLELGGDLAARITAMLSAKPEAVVLVSTFQRTGGDPEAGRRLARQRAAAIRNQLVRNGVAARRILLRQPELSLVTNQPVSAEYVEVRVQ